MVCSLCAVLDNTDPGAQVALSGFRSFVVRSVLLCFTRLMTHGPVAISETLHRAHVDLSDVT